MQKLLEEIEQYAKLNKVPVMQADSMEYLCTFIKEHNLKNILELGSAIGYSASKMALVDKDIHVTSIERDYDRYNVAKENINKLGLEDQITLIHDDINNYHSNNLYDLIFIDASKGHNITFFNRFKDNLQAGGYIITDNMSFHGLVEDESLALTKNQRKIASKIRNYITFLDNNKEYSTIYVNVGDKLAISSRKEASNE